MTLDGPGREAYGGFLMNMPLRSRRASPRVTCLLALSLLLMGCRTSDTHSRSSTMSDFRVGQVYQLMVPAFIIANTGLVMTVEESRQRPPMEMEANLEPGTFFTVRQILPVNDREPRTEIYAEIISGPLKKRVVNLRTASLADGPPGTTRRNPAVFEPFFLGR